MLAACLNLTGLDAKIHLGSLKVLVRRIIQFLSHAFSQVTTTQTNKTKKGTSTANHLAMGATDVKTSKLAKVDPDLQITITRFVGQVCFQKR